MKQTTKLILLNVFTIAITLAVGLITFWTTNRVFVNLGSHISTEDAFKFGFLLMGNIIIFFLLVISSLNLREKTHNQILYYFILLITNAHMLGVIYAMSGVGSITTLYFGELVSLISTPTVLIVFWFYQRNIYLGENYRKTRVDNFVLLMGLFDHFQIYFATYQGNLFSFDENNRLVTGSWIPFTYIYPILVLLLCIADNFKNKMSRQRHVSCFFFAFTPMALAITAVATGDYVYSHVAYVISVLIIYVGIQANMETEKIRKEETFALQKKLLEKDALTELFSRFSYSKDILKLQEGKGLPNDLVIFAMDVNGLKAANDSKGHEAGDELIKGSADCISAALSAYGKCYRTGGDEFVSILNISSDQVSALVKNLKAETQNWHGQLVDELSISVGTATVADNPDANLKKLLSLADQSMYEDKERYYMETGKNRRRAR